jgi:hypothetical protein
MRVRKFNGCPLTFLFISFSFFANGQFCSETTGTPGWTTVGAISNTAGNSFDWQNTTTPGQFQAGTNQGVNSTSVTTPILQYLDASAHSSVNIAYDLIAANGSSSTISGYELMVIWGAGGSTQVAATGGILTVSNSPTQYNFHISGLNLPGHHTPFQVRLKFSIGNSKNVNASNFKTDAALANSGIALYVQISSFNASRNNYHVNLNWTTNYEMNNLGFEIQRRYNNQTNFETIDFVHSKATNGTSTGLNDYTYKDQNYSSTTSFYRIRQVNKDGTSKFTEIRQVDGGKFKANAIVYPNPSTTGMSNLVFTNPNSKEIKIFDNTGRMVRSWSNHIGQDLKIISLKPGFYSISVINRMTSEKETMNLVVTK